MTRIGQWCFRLLGKAHFIESEIVERFVTHCGRELAEFTPSGGTLHFAAAPDWQHPACVQCAPRLDAPNLNTRGAAP